MPPFWPGNDRYSEPSSGFRPMTNFTTSYITILKHGHVSKTFSFLSLYFDKLSVESGTPIVKSGMVPGENWDTDTALTMRVI